jgi:hypothetical protein
VGAGAGDDAGGLKLNENGWPAAVAVVWAIGRDEGRSDTVARPCGSAAGDGVGGTDEGVAGRPDGSASAVGVAVRLAVSDS